MLARKRKYVLPDMIAQCNPKASPPDDVKLRGVAKPAGQEIGGVNFFDESDVVSVPPDPAIGHEQKGTGPLWS